MAVLKQIDPSTFPTSGAATTGTTGLYAITGGTHVGSTDLPAGSTATGYIEGADGAALTFNMDHTGNDAGGLFGATGTPTAGNKGVVGFWYYAELTDSTLAAITDPASSVSYLAFSSTVGAAAPTCFVIGAVIKNVTVPSQGSGLALFVYSGTVTSATTAAGLGHTRTCANSRTLATTSLIRPNIPFGRWVYLTYELILGTGTAGKLRLNVNGQRVGEADVDTGTTATVVNNFQVSLPAITGVKHRIIPDNSWRSTGHPSYTAQYLTPSNYLTVADWPVTFSGGGEGDNWTVTYSGGATSAQTAIRPLCPLSTLGADSERMVTSLLTGQTVTCTSKRQYGTLPYNDEGWAFIAFRRIVFRSDSTGIVQVKNSGGTVVGEVYWNYNAALKIRLGSLATSELVCDTPPSGSEGMIVFGFNSDGRAVVAVIDTSSNPCPTASTVRRCVGSHRFSWTPANIGDLVVYQGSYIGSGTAVVEFGGASFERYLGVVGADSWTEATHFVTGFDYFTWTTGTAAPVAGSVVTYTDGTTGTVIASGNTGTKWVVTYSNNQFVLPASSAITVTGTGAGTITNASVTSKVSWVSHGAVTGTFARDETVTETTTSITGRLVMSGTLDASYVPPGLMGFGSASGQFRGGLTLTGGTSGATCTGDFPHNGAYRATLANGLATKAYNCHRDCEAAAVFTPFAASGTSKAISCLIPIGRAGKYPSLIEEGAMSGISDIPGVFLFIVEGIVNALLGATSVPLGLTIAAREADAVLRAAFKIASNDGRVLIELPTFNAGGSYGFNQVGAQACVTEYRARILAGVRGSNYRRRIEVADIGNTFPSSTDGVHPNDAGRAELAQRVNASRNTPTGGSGSRVGRSGR